MSKSENMTKNIWLAAGDIHDDIFGLLKLLEHKNIKGFIISGDLTNCGDCEKAQKIIGEFEKTGIPLYAQIGNMDLMEVNDLLEKRGCNLHCHVRELMPDIAVFGIGGSTPTPMNTPAEFSEKSYAGWLEKEWQTACKYPHTILISHNPPKNSACDVIGGGIHVGSEAVRHFIEKYQPEICICGHIHESKGIDQIGRTKIINPGALSEGGYVILEYENGMLSARLGKL